MRWRGGRRSGNVEDRRGLGGVAVGGGIGGIVLVVAALLLGVDPGVILNGGGSSPPAEMAEPGATGSGDPLYDFSTVVLASTEDVWHARFTEAGRDYAEPTLVVFEGATPSACGLGQSAMGPFYCARDASIYLDLSFFRELRERLGAPGDFAQAYVIAHEVGHHVQNLNGVMQGIGSATGPNSDAVRLELQADCLAGVWGYYAGARGILEPGDLEEALNAAAAIGDDRLQRRSQGTVVPDAFTHGTSAQRVAALRAGLESGHESECGL